MKNFLIKNKKKLIIAGVILLVLIAYAAVEPLFLVRDEVRFSSAGIKNEFNGYKIVFVSDIHNGPYMSDARIEDLLERINSEDADLILLGGDYIQSKKREFNTVCEFFISNLKSKDGVYYIFGNHDFRVGVDYADAAMQSAGAIPLHNKNARIVRGGESIVIAGTDDYEFGIINFNEAYRDIRPEDFAVLLSHNPNILPYLTHEQIGSTDLALFGHTHGGQVTFFGIFSFYKWSKPFAFYKNTMQNYRGLDFIDSNGFGTSGLPFRFMALPQYHVITLETGYE